MGKSKVSRRDFIRFAGVASGAALLGACAPQVVTQVVKETADRQPDPDRQVQTQVVSGGARSPPRRVPALVTLQGRELPLDAAPLDKQIFRQGGAEPKHLDTARDIYSSGATNLGNEPLLRNNENIETVPALAESGSPAPTPSTGTS